jgi:hypothetical protein
MILVVYQFLLGMLNPIHQYCNVFEFDEADLQMVNRTLIALFPILLSSHDEDSPSRCALLAITPMDML